jgi:hypothetical protein
MSWYAWLLQWYECVHHSNLIAMIIELLVALCEKAENAMRKETRLHTRDAKTLQCVMKATRGSPAFLLPSYGIFQE